jgi:hypothetical protein
VNDFEMPVSCARHLSDLSGVTSDTLSSYFGRDTALRSRFLVKK